MGRIALFDQAAVDELLDQQYGLITRRQALDRRITRAALAHRLRECGTWQVLLPGVYLSCTGRPTGPQRLVAALLYAGPDSAITGPAALAAHGIRGPESADVDVLVPVACQRQSIRFVRLHRSSRMPDAIQSVGPIRYAPAVRAVADAARGAQALSEVRAIVAGAVQRGKAGIVELGNELANGPIAGSALFRRVLLEVADGVRSAAEADLRELIKRERLPGPVFNPRLYAGRIFIGMPDAWWPEAGLAVEIDSREWHLSPGDWERTMARHSRMSTHGIVMLHYPPRRLRTEPRVVAAEIRAAVVGGRPLPAVRAMPSATSAS
jgi:chorismate-pyruvate lyase